jgi:hypothetical protein
VSAFYRDRAEESRELAEQAKVALDKEVRSRMAAEWFKLAQDARAAAH